jgi:hypothetical protein
LFRRANCSGFQGGVAYDYLSDRFNEDIDLSQIRCELSYLFHEYGEIGYYGSYGLNSSPLKHELELQREQTNMRALDLYAFFVRHYFENCGDGRVWGGVTGYGDGAIGADFWLPLGRNLALENAVTYVIPKGGNHERESWGLAMSLVWYPGRSTTIQQHNPYRPIFNTADNTTFVSQRVR